MQTFRSHGGVGEPAPPERVFGAAPRGHYGHAGRRGRGRGRPDGPPPAADGPDRPAPAERNWVDQDFEDPYLE